MMTAKRMNTEKGSILMMGMLLVSLGVTTIATSVGVTLDIQRIVVGMVITIFGCVLVYWRETLKNHRWGRNED